MESNFKQQMVKIYVVANNAAADDLTQLETASKIMAISGESINTAYETRSKGFTVPTSPSGVKLEINSFIEILNNGIFKGGA